MTGGFLILPPELRIAVYKELLLSCLTDGVPSDAGSLYLTCQLIKWEMDEWVAKARPYLELLNGWTSEQVSHAQKKALQIPRLYLHIAPALFSDTVLTSITIDLPGRVDEWCPENAVQTWSVFCLPTRSLTLRFSTRGGPIDLKYPRDSSIIMCNFNKLLWCFPPPREPPTTFQHIKRLVLFVGEPDQDRGVDAWLVTSTRFTEGMLSRALSKQFEWDQCSAWVAITQVDRREDWSIGFDFEKGLKEPDCSVFKRINEV